MTSTPLAIPATSREWWSINGVPLHGPAWSVTTKSGRRGVIAYRGSNAQVAGVPGELYLPKILDAQVLNLPMWVQGVDPETGATVADPVRRFNDNLAFLHQVLWNPDAQFTITKRILRTAPDGTAALWTLEGSGALEVGADLQPTMTGEARATLTVPIRMAHPFFYGPASSIRFRINSAAQVLNPGDWHAWSRNLYIDFVGGTGHLLTNPAIYNTTASTPVYCGLTGTVANGETVTLDVGNYLALSTFTGSAAKTNRTGDIYNSGAQPWNLLYRGLNTIGFTATSGTGYALLRFRPPYQ